MVTLNRRIVYIILLLNAKICPYFTTEVSHSTVLRRILKKSFKFKFKFIIEFHYIVHFSICTARS